MKNLFVLFVFALMISAIKTKNLPNKNVQIVRVDVKSRAIVDKKFTLFIPLSLKFGDKLVNENKQGVINLYINDQKFCYKRPSDVKRNEYFLDVKCGNNFTVLIVEKGDKITIKFAKSNLMQPENVVLYGEEEK